MGMFWTKCLCWSLHSLNYIYDSFCAFNKDLTLPLPFFFVWKKTNIINIRKREAYYSINYIILKSESYGWEEIREDNCKKSGMNTINLVFLCSFKIWILIAFSLVWEFGPVECQQEAEPRADWSSTSQSFQMSNVSPWINCTRLGTVGRPILVITLLRKTTELCWMQMPYENMTKVPRVNIAGCNDWSFSTTVHWEPLCT